MEKRATLSASVAAVLAGLLLSFVLHDSNSVPNIYSDIGSFWGRTWVSSGQFPYVSEFFEYPPISGLILYAARIIGGTQEGYYDAFSLMSMAAGVVLVWSCWKVAKKLGRTLNPMYFALPSVIIYGIYNFDLFHAMFIMLSLQAFLYGKRSASAALLGLAISTKLVSGVLLPVFLLEILAPSTLKALRQWKWRDAWWYLLVTLVVVGAFNIPFMFANLGNWTQTYTYLSNWGLENAWFGWIFQSPDCITSSTCAAWGYAKMFGFALMGVLLLRVYTLRTDVTTKSFLALTAYLLGTYIYSPQFNLVLLPLVAVLMVDHPSLYLWEGFNALIILTWFIGSADSATWHPTLPWTLPQEFALLRAVMLGWMALWVLKLDGWDWRALLPFQKQKTLESELA